MTTTLKSITCLLLIIYFVSSCTTQKGEIEMTKDKIFPTPEEAAKEARNNLVQILESYKDINLDINIDKLRKSKLTSLVQYVLVDFEKIISSDSVTSLSKIVASDKSIIAPFILNNEIIGITEVVKISDGWKVSGLGNKAIRDDLNYSRVLQTRNPDVTLYEVPNLHLMIYGVNENSLEMYFLDFEQFTLKEAVAIEEFYPMMRKRAIQFDKEFGARLKREKLLK